MIFITFLIQENRHDEIQGSKFAQEMKIVYPIVTFGAYLMLSNSKQIAKILSQYFRTGTMVLKTTYVLIVFTVKEWKKSVLIAYRLRLTLRS